MANPGIAVPGAVVPSGSQASPAGPQGIQGPTAVSTDAGNLAVLGSDNLVSVPTSAITAVRLRSFNAIGNPTFEVDQRSAGVSTATLPASAGGWGIDRWNPFMTSAVTARASYQQIATNVALPGTNFLVTFKILRWTLTTAQASLGAFDQLAIWHFPEGPVTRELYNDVSSVSILVRSSVANLKFGCLLVDNAFSRTLAKLCTLGAANTWVLIALPNLPSMVSSGGIFPLTPGSVGYNLVISLSFGASQLVAA